jgi:sialate O-acetylesterase
MATRDNPTDSAWAELREAQRMTAESVPHCGLASTTDIGAAKDPHPKNKQDVGKRLALVALAKTYGRDVVYSGPTYTSMKVEDNRVRLSFKHVHGGLVAKPEGPLKGFAVAGKDRRFVWAQAKIEGDTIVLWNDEIREPTAVRYAWADNPVCNLFNVEGLPALPFRTDDWEQRARE